MTIDVVYCGVLKQPPPFDVKEHLRVLHRQVLPLFFILCGIVMVIIISVQAGRKGADLPPEDYVGARVGLLQAVEKAPFDPAFAVLSPIDLVLAPAAVVFDTGQPVAKRPAAAEAIEVRAPADGFVVKAAMGEKGATVILVHEREGLPVETVHRGLGSLRVSVGAQVRRGQVLGVLSGGDQGDLPFARRSFPALVSGAVAGEEGGIPAAWRGRASDRLSPPPAGEPIEPSALKLGAPLPPADPVP